MISDHTDSEGPSRRELRLSPESDSELPVSWVSASQPPGIIEASRLFPPGPLMASNLKSIGRRGRSSESVLPTASATVAVRLEQNDKPFVT